MSVVKAPPRKDIWLVWAQYGQLGGARTIPRARLWILAESQTDLDCPLTATIAWNHPSTGAVVYEDLGEIRKVVINSRIAEVHLPTGSIVTLTIAPCVCGAGAVGQAPPEEGRISLQYVTMAGRSRLRVT